MHLSTALFVDAPQMHVHSCLSFSFSFTCIAMGPADPYTTTTTNTTSTTNGTNAPIPVAENSQSNTSGAPAPAKWLQPKNESEMETDKVGLVAHNRGYKHILFSLYLCFFVCKLFSLHLLFTILNLLLPLLNNWAPSDAQFGGNKLRAPRTLARQEEVKQE